LNYDNFQIIIKLIFGLFIFLILFLNCQIY
ncbi:unnamed protein product, partial [Rotaria magnacalcarata]